MKSIMKRGMFISAMVLFSILILMSCDNNNSTLDNTSSKSSLSEVVGTWECDFYDMGSLNIMYLTIKSNGKGHIKWTYQQGFQTQLIMAEDVTVKRDGNQLEVSVLNPNKYNSSTYFTIDNGIIYMPNGEKMKRNYNH